MSHSSHCVRGFPRFLEVLNNSPIAIASFFIDLEKDWAHLFNEAIKVLRVITKTDCWKLLERVFNDPIMLSNISATRWCQQNTIFSIENLKRHAIDERTPDLAACCSAAPGQHRVVMGRRAQPHCKAFNSQWGLLAIFNFIFVVRGSRRGRAVDEHCGAVS